MRTVLAVVGLSLVASLGAGTATGGVVANVAPTVVVSAIDRGAWAREIGAARSRSPSTFERVAAVRARLPELDATRRGRLAPVPQHLEHLGSDAVLALVERVLDGESDGALTATARTAWRAGVVEALGHLRDPRTREVVAPLLDDPDPVVAAAAAQAIARLADDTSVALLAARIAKGELPVVSGAGVARRRPIASALAALLASRPSTEVARAAVRSLADNGAAWAFRTGKVALPGEESDVRSISARALVATFVGYDGEVRQAASNALMVVDDPSTPALIAAAKSSASSDTIAALDQLAARFARNPAR
ncbi:MAG: HEAT repeat domain-containing protein [Deltaproteobacteria bacterium]|nr:HEAT repeat domain-containing protein [Deltaproteobacteria bacterium]